MKGVFCKQAAVCSDGVVSVLAVNLIRQPRIPGIDNVSEIGLVLILPHVSHLAVLPKPICSFFAGSSYNFTEEDRFKLCG